MKNRQNIYQAFLWLITIGFISSGIGTADDVKAEAKFEEAKALFAKRSATNLTDDAMAKLEEARAEVEDLDLEYQIIIMHAKCLYWKAIHTVNTNEQATIFDLGRKKAQEAIDLEPDYADGYYHEAAHHVRWGKLQPLLVQKQEVEEALKTLKEVRKRFTSDMESEEPMSGKTYAGYGADRIEAAMNYKANNLVKLLFGFSNAKAISLLENAVEKAPNHSSNLLYLAEAYIADGQNAKAIPVLKKLISVDPQTFNVDRIPETMEDVEEAKKKLKEIE